MTTMMLKDRLKYLYELIHGWDNYDGKKITDISILVAEKYLVNNFTEKEIETIYIYPMPSGGVQIEYFDVSGDVEIEIYDYDITIF